MANRLNAPNQFETLAPPWILSQLDTNFTQNQAAWNDSSLGFVNGIPVDTGSANAYSISLPFGTPSALNNGFTCFWIPANSNTGGSTLTVSPLGSAAILNRAGLALTGGEIIVNKMLGMVYSANSPVGFRIFTPCGLSYQATAPGNVTLNCAGYDAVSASVFFNSATTTALTLSNLGYGVSVNILFSNSFSSPVAYSIQATDPGGVAGNCSILFCNATATTGASRTVLQSGATVNAQSLTNGNAICFNGVTKQAGSSMFLELN